MLLVFSTNTRNLPFDGEKQSPPPELDVPVDDFVALERAPEEDLASLDVLGELTMPGANSLSSVGENTEDLSL